MVEVKEYLSFIVISINMGIIKYLTSISGKRCKEDIRG
jgi:hypothetical protein